MSIFDRFKIVPTLLASFLVCVFACFCFGCGLSDLRPDSFSPTTEGESQARAKLGALPAAHGGLEQWQAHKTVKLSMVDTWPTWLMRTFGMGWDRSPATLEQDILLGQDTSRLSSPKRDIGMDEGIAQWGVQNWATYKVSTSGKVSFEAHEDAWFWLPTLEYFFEAPFRLHEAQKVMLLAPKTRQGRSYDRIYVTWGSWDVSDTIDQYVVWIDQKTGLLGYLEFTARDVYGFVDGLAIYKGWHEVQGIQVPKSIVITQGAEELEDVLHQIDYTNIKFGHPYSSDYFFPRPGAKAQKSAKGAL